MSNIDDLIEEYTEDQSIDDFEKTEPIDLIEKSDINNFEKTEPIDLIENQTLIILKKMKNTIQLKNCILMIQKEIKRTVEKAIDLISSDEFHILLLMKKNYLNSILMMHIHCM